MRVLVTGGAGYIGSHTVRELLNARHEVLVFDNLANGHLEAVDLRAEFFHGSTAETEKLKNILVKNDIEAVLHFAANIEVAESFVDPYTYYQNNTANTLNLLKAIVDCGVKKFIFSSTAAVYGNPVLSPLTEDEPRLPVNPYGRTKMMSEMILEDFCKAYDISYTILRYFNVAGASPVADIGEDHHPETHLIPRLLAAALDPRGEVKIYGTDYPTFDGTCIRDYVHVVDLARAHVLALAALKSKEGNIYNLGSEKGFSVRQVIAACEKITETTYKITEEPRRAGDPAVLVASSEKIRFELGWKPFYPDISTIVYHAWRWHKSHPHGYEKIKKEILETEFLKPNFYLSR